MTLSTNDTTSTSGNYKAGTYDLTPSAATGTGTANYDISYATDTSGLGVAQKALTVSGIAGTDRTYNGTTADALSGTAALSGNVSGDSLTLNGPGVGTLDSPNAGPESVTISGYSVSSGNANNDAANYAFSQPAVANVTIAQEALTLTATDQSKTYGFGGTSAALGTTGFTAPAAPSTAPTSPA